MRAARFIAFAAAALGGTASSIALADTVTYWGYPTGGAPGGSTTAHISGSGAINAGGTTTEYSGFNSSAYTSLYWVIDTVAGAPYLGQSTSDTLAFDASRSSLSTGVLAFDGSYSLQLDAGGTASYFGELLVTVTNTSGNPLSLDSPSLHTGMAAADGGAVNVTGPYEVNFQFLMGPNSSSLEAASTFFNGEHASQSGQLLSSFSGGFYYTPVPIPASAWLFLSGFLGLGALGYRRRA
jgi:hypothetical protein